MFLLDQSLAHRAIVGTLQFAGCGVRGPIALIIRIFEEFANVVPLSRGRLVPMLYLTKTER